jgi:adenylate cyclase
MYAGEPARALEPFAKAMRLDPHYPDIVLHFLAQANFSLGKYEIAAQQLLDRIARNPSTDASRMLLASCYGHLGRAEEARAVWAELLKVNPDFSLMQRARGGYRFLTIAARRSSSNLIASFISSRITLE